MNKSRIIFLILAVILFFGLGAFIWKKSLNVNLIVEKKDYVNKNKHTIKDISTPVPFSPDSMKIIPDNFEMEKGTPELFASFLESFPDTSLPLIFEKGSINKFKFDGEAPLRMDEMYSPYVPSLKAHLFSRMPVENQQHFIAKIKEADNYIAVLYSEAYRETEFDNPKGQDVTIIVLSTFNKNGEIISSQPIAEFGYPHQFSYATIDSAYVIETKKYIRNFEKDPIEYGYFKNTVKEEVFIGIERFNIAENGKITPIEEKMKQIM